VDFGGRQVVGWVEIWRGIPTLAGHDAPGGGVAKVALTKLGFTFVDLPAGKMPER